MARARSSGSAKTPEPTVALTPMARMSSAPSRRASGGGSAEGSGAAARAWSLLLSPAEDTLS
jgi:hypothetical protein